MIARLQDIIARLERLPSIAQEKLAEQIDLLIKSFEHENIPSRKSFAGVMSDLPDDFLDDLDRLRHIVPPTPPIENL